MVIISILLFMLSLAAAFGFLVAAAVRKGRRMKMLKLAGVSALAMAASATAAGWLGNIELQEDKIAAEEGGFSSVEQYRHAKTVGYTTKEEWAAAMQELKEKVAEVPASDYEENIRLYKELRKLGPNNKRYGQKISYYETKRDEARAAKQAELRRREEEAKQVAAENVTYTILEENIYDKPIMTLIKQGIVVSGVPTKSALEAEILKRYRAANARRGFRYHNPATNIAIYVYGTEEQARAGQGLWIGMISKGSYDKADPPVAINEERLAALSQAPVERFGLTEQQRKQAFREIAAAEDRARLNTMIRIPDADVMGRIDLEREFEEKYKAEVAQKYDLTKEQLLEITVEGVKKGWAAPAPTPFPSTYSSFEDGVSYRISRETPLMPTRPPYDDAIAALATLRTTKPVPAGYTIEIVGSMADDGNPWYEVVVWDREGNRRGAGWINSTALLGQELEPIER